jgi:putative two-component system response regulator
MPARILIVDDDPQVRALLVRFVEREGYRSVTACNGRDGLNLVLSEQPDLVLLDVSMDGLNGFDVCQALKEDERTALIPVTFITGDHDREARQRAIEAGADDFLTKPIDPSLLSARLRTQLRLKRLTDQLESTECVIFSMARWVEFKDPYTEGHLRRISGYSEEIGRVMGLGPEELRTIRYAGILHDIGKIGVSQAILDKPGPLDPDEQAELRLHAEYGAAIVAPLRFASQVAPIILAHHEHWEGTGYPHGLRGEGIPIGARIIAVVDAFDAMTTDRPYRRSLGAEEAIRRLRKGGGSQWDPVVVEVFLDLLTRGELPLGDLPWFELGTLPAARVGEITRAD